MRHAVTHTERFPYIVVSAGLSLRVRRKDLPEANVVVILTVG